MLQRLKWLFIAFIWILQVKEMFINGLPLNGTFSSSISTNKSADSLNTSLNTRANQSESLSNRTTLLDSFQINTWYQSKKEHQAPGVNLVLLPVGALVCFLVMISLRFCTWQREDHKFKERGCSYDVTNYVILIQGDADYSDVDIRSETLSNYDTVNSYVSGVPKSPWRAHSAMPAYVSLQSRIDSQMYDTVTSYRSYLQSPHGRKTFNFDKKDIIENDKIVNSKQTPQRPRKIPGTRFSIVPALDNYMRLKSLNKPPSQPESPKLLRMASESPDTLSSNDSDIGVVPRRNKKSRVSFTDKSKDCGQNRRPRKCKMVDAQTQVGFRRSKTASQKSNSTTNSSMASEPIERVNSGGETPEKRTSVSHESLNSDLKRSNNIEVKAEVYNDQKFCNNRKICEPCCDRTTEGKENLQNCYLTSQNEDHTAVKGVTESTQFVSERTLSAPVSNDYAEIQINITENPYVTPPKEQTTSTMTSSLLCCPSIPPKTKSETDLFKNNNNNSSMENLCRRKSCDIIQKSRGKNAKISPIGIHQTRCFCDNQRKFSLGAISNDTNSVFKSKNRGTSLSSLKDVLNLRKKNCEQNGNLLQKSESRSNVETV
ncbi:uncharacterized protein LOC134283029 [Saccostrea cucullata]|uniref:uncharacterized protein LOC134283029 n=1 Tax=Saccostrea cuccullata TaxID=36930 RepID=UPI002ED4BEBD